MTITELVLKVEAIRLVSGLLVGIGILAAATGLGLIIAAAEKAIKAMNRKTLGQEKDPEDRL